MLKPSNTYAFFALLCCCSPVYGPFLLYGYYKKKIKKRKENPPLKLEFSKRKRALSFSLGADNGLGRWKEKKMRKITAAQDESLWFRLPPELRNMIYREYIGSEIRVVWQEEGDPEHSDCLSGERSGRVQAFRGLEKEHDDILRDEEKGEKIDVLPLLKTCRKIIITPNWRMYQVFKKFHDTMRDRRFEPQIIGKLIKTLHLCNAPMGRVLDFPPSRKGYALLRHYTVSKVSFAIAGSMNGLQDLRIVRRVGNLSEWKQGWKGDKEWQEFTEVTTAMNEEDKGLTFELVQHDASGIAMEKIKWEWGTGPEGNGRKEWVLLERR